MAKSSPWPIIHAHRTALAEDLADLGEDRWTTPSLCPNWSVRDVLAHLTSTAKMTPPRFFGHLASAGFNFKKMTAKDIAAESTGTGAAVLAEFRAVSGRTTSPPGPIDSMLGEIVMHSEDIRRPLGIKSNCTPEVAARAADFYKGSNLLIGAKNRVAGLTLKADDIEWTHGTGPVVEGPMLSLGLAMTGRRAGLDDLSGAGLATLTARMP